jgi:hypothetical protein
MKLETYSAIGAREHFAPESDFNGATNSLTFYVTLGTRTAINS